MLCGLGAASFATTAAGKRQSLTVLLLAFVGGAVFLRPEALPPAAWTGCIVAVAATLYLFRPETTIATSLCGGFLAALGTALLQIQGIPWPLALILFGIVPGISAYLATKRPVFAPDTLRQEAMLLMIALGLAVAMIPEISSGWLSAEALNRSERSNVDQVIATWVFVLVAASLVLGGFYSLLRRR